MKRTPSVIGLFTLILSLFQLPGLAFADTAPPGFDVAPQGDWVGRYGADGHVLASWNGTTPGSDLVSAGFPASVTLTQGSRWQWEAPSTSVKALQSPDTSTRRAATWYDSTAVIATLSFPAAYSGPLDVYAVDWDAGGRRQTVVVDDGTTVTSVVLDADFSTGAWGHTTISVPPEGGTVTVTATPDAGANAVISGLFLGEIPALSAPRTPSATAGDNTVNVAWTAPEFNGGSAVTEYRVFRAETSGGQDFGAAPLGTSATLSYDDGTAVNGTQYFYVVRAFNGTTEGPSSAEVSATPGPPATPTGVDAASSVYNKVVVSWSAGAGPAAASYKVYRSDSELGTYTVVASPASSPVTDTGRTAQTTYWYKVSAVNTAGESALSAPVSVTTPAVPFTQAPQGDWVGVHGWDGHVLSSWNGTTSGSDLVSAGFPASVTLTQGSRFRWEVPSASVVALQSPDTSTRRAATWYDATAVKADLAFTQGYSGDLAVYMVDWNASTRRQTVSVKVNGGAPTSIVVDQAFTNGAWVVFPISVVNGDVVTVTATRDAGVNAVISGLFLAGAPLGAPRTPSATSGNSTVTLNWSAPQFTGGSAVTEYRVFRAETSGGQDFGSAPLATPTSTSFVDSTAVNGTQYFYVVRAFNGSTEGPSSAEVSAIPGPPATPTGVGASSSVYNKVVVSWTAGAGPSVASYKVYRSDSELGTYTLLSSPTASPVTDTGRTAQTTYWYKVSAVNPAGESALSAAVSATTPAVPFTQSPQGDWVGVHGSQGHVLSSWNGTTPTDDLVSAGFPASVTLTQGSRFRWEVPSTATRALQSPDTSTRRAATWYDTGSVIADLGFTEGYSGDLAVYMVDWNTTARRQTVSVKINGGAPTSIVVDQAFNNGAWVVFPISVVDTDVVTVTATRNAGTNAVISGLFLGGAPALSAPRTPSATAGDNTVNVAWTAPEFNGGSAVTEYRVFRAETSGGQDFGSAPLGTSATLSYDDGTAVNGTQYFYVVRAFNGSTEGPSSAEVSAIPGPPATPTGVGAASSVYNKVVVSWTAAAGPAAASFKVYRSLTEGGTYTALPAAPTASPFTDTGRTAQTTYWYKVSAVNPAGESALSAAVSATTPAQPFTQSPQGDWVGVHGSQGHVLSSWNGTTPTDDLVSAGFPASVSLTQGSRFRWQVPATSVAALQSPDTSTRRAATWYDATAVKADLGFTEGYSGDLAVYMVDWNASARRQTVSVQINGGAPTSIVVDQAFTNGAWVVFPISVVDTDVVTVTATRDAGVNAVISGLFLGGAPALSAPRTPSATPGDNTVNVAWTAPEFNGGSAVTEYRVFRAETSGGQDFGSAPLGTSATLSYDDGTAVNGTQYFYVVRAFNGSTEGPSSAEVSAIPGPPATPTGVGAASSVYNKVVVSWSAGAGPAAASFKVYRSLTEGGTYTALPASPTASPLTDTGRTAQTTYWYKVSAVNPAGESALSAAVSATTPAVPFTQSPQGDWVGVHGSQGHVLSSWNGTTPTDDLVSAGFPASVTLTQGSRFRWEVPSTATRALQSPDTSTRRAATWYDTGSVIADLGFTEGYSGDLAVYMVDWNTTARRQTVSVKINGGAPTSIVVDQAFNNGAWVVFPISVVDTDVVTVTATRDAGVNAVISGLFLGGAPALSAPRTPSATAGDNTVNVAWTAPEFNGGSAVTEYRVFRAETSGGQDFGSAPLGTSATLSYDDGTAVNGTQYFYVVRAFNGSTEGPSSAEVSAIPGPPATPTGVGAASSVYNKVVVSWTAAAGPAAASFKVYRSLTEGGTYTALPAAPTASPFTDTGRTAQTTYWYKVSAVNPAGESALSAAVSATTPAQPFTQSPQGDWVGVHGSQGHVLSSWNGTTPTDDLVSAGFPASVSLTQGSRFRWQVPATSVAALQSPDTSTRRAATWYDATAVKADLGFTEGYSGDLAVYMVDWNASARRQTVSVQINGGAPTSIVVDQAFTNGAWVVFPISVVDTDVVTVTATRDAGVNAVISGLFLKGLGAPTGLAAAPSATQTAIDLTWTAPVMNNGATISGYKVLRGTSPESLSVIDSTVAPEYTDLAVEVGVTYFYAVQAVASPLVGPSSSSVSAAPNGAPAASTLTLDSAADGTVLLSWTVPADNGGAIEGYRVFRQATGEETFTELTPATAPYWTDTNYSDTGLDASGATDYTYYVVAINAYGDGASSNTVIATPSASV